MRKIVACNLDLLKVEAQKNESPSVAASQILFFRGEMKKLVNEGENKLFFFSRDRYLLDEFKQMMKNEGDNFAFCLRKELQDVFTDNRSRNSLFVIVSGKDVDFQLAVRTKTLFVVPGWINIEEKASRYGIHVDNIKQLIGLVRVLNNQNAWFFSLAVDVKTKVYALVDARYKYRAESSAEEQLIRGFQAMLKENNPNAEGYRKLLLYHFIAAYTNTPEFDDIELFGVIPSSNCDVNEYMFELMTYARELKGKRLPKNYDKSVPNRYKNLLLRHKAKSQNHGGGRTPLERMNMGSKEELETIQLNPDYKQRMTMLAREKRLNVCVFDDYITHGNSFNAVRNLLEKVGVNKIVFVSIGSFAQGFQKWDYKIDGDVFSSDYSYTLIHEETLTNYHINHAAKEEVESLFKIFIDNESI